MKTTIKSIRLEKFDNEYTGKLLITIADDILCFTRDVDGDGVITFKQAESKSFKMNIAAFSAQCRNTIDSKFVTAFGYRIDTAKAISLEEFVNVLNILLQSATIEIEAQVQAKDETKDDSHESIFYKISNLKLDNLMNYIVAQYFVENFMKVPDVVRQQTFINKIFDIKL